ncbi:hypothetical protein [Paracoccus jiaweipingae]|uniref:hypothetical protein n=1 Tax=unclassified Paracoccus (in: a-proteobacteria) TaxID=2688777 RepID=UPI0037AE3421
MTKTPEMPVFPRAHDSQPPAWQHDGPQPVHPWERFSPAYEAQAERIVKALAGRGLHPEFGGAGSEDGEFVAAADASGDYVFLVHLEDPETGEMLAGLDADGLAEWLDWSLQNG